MAGEKNMPNGDMPNGDMDEWDALEAEIARELDGQKDRTGKREPSPLKGMDLNKAADEFLKANKDTPADIEAEDDEAPTEDASALRIAELETELATLKDQALRVRAEADNIRKRSEREVQNAKLYGVEKFAADVLSVYDNLSRALHTIDGQAKEELGDNARNLVEGIELTEKELTSVLERHKVKTVAGVGSKFDPNVHQAVANIPHPEIEKGHVAAVMQQGFTIGERTLRAAMVAVSTGPAG
jgi:molecular chaperone GrpE